MRCLGLQCIRVSQSELYGVHAAFQQQVERTVQIFAASGGQSGIQFRQQRRGRGVTEIAPHTQVTEQVTQARLLAPGVTQTGQRACVVLSSAAPLPTQPVA